MHETSKQQRRDHTLLGTMLVALSGLLYGMIGYFGMQLFYDGFSVPSMLFWRFLTASLWMILAAVMTRRSLKKLQGKWPLIFKLAAVGAMSYTGGSAFFYLASLHIGTGPAMVIFFSFPVFVTLFSYIFKRSSLNRYVVIALLMVVGGLVLLNGSGDYNLNNRGIALALIAAFSYGVYVYYSQDSSKQVDSLWLTMLICMGCALISLIFAVGSSTVMIPETSRQWINILILGVLATAIPIQLLLNGLKYISSVKASILSVLEPVVTVIVGVTCLHESLQGIQILGILVTLAGALVIQFEKQPEFKAKTPLK